MNEQKNKQNHKKSGRTGTRWFAALFKALLLFLLLCLLTLAGTAAYIFFIVIPAPSEEIAPGNIDRLLSVESPVFYADAREKIGVFFEEAHREYVPYSQIPRSFVTSLLAAEDHRFFEHRGIDLVGLGRAVMVNLRAGRVLQGGSTLTQQTAKNLFKRRDRSLGSKFRELIHALRLERAYSKEKIFEFYTNQFFVSGNGHGLSMAARYYFDKKVEDLDLLESAFIAGSVKRPNFYNPFLAKSEEGRQVAIRHADERTKFVLRQMQRFGMIDDAEFERHQGRQIPFKQGKMAYSHDTVMDLVKAALATTEVETALEDRGIDNVATSGIRIITTIKKPLQDESVVALRKELSNLDVQLAGYERDAVQEGYKALTSAEGDLRTGGFVFGRIVKIDRDPAMAVTVSLAGKGGAETGMGVIDRAGFDHLLKPFAQHTRGKTAAGDSDLAALGKQLKEGDQIYVHLRNFDEAANRFQLDLEKYPEIQGGAIVLESGAIRAMVGGMENVFFNRAITARRPMGSVMKPIIYAAAMQLGWNSVDLLHNERNLFVYGSDAYFPKPDHESPFADVSMNWAGTLSENVASVWLLYHLCDHLSPAQFKDIVQHLDLARRSDESFQRYAARLRDKHGIAINDQALYRTSFQKAVKAVEPDLLFDGHGDEVRQLLTFQYDTGHLIDRSEERSEEADTRQALLARSFLAYRDMADQLAERLRGFVAGRESVPTGISLYQRDSETYAFFAGGAPSSWHPVREEELLETTEFMGQAARERFAQDILLNGRLRLDTVKLVAAALEKEYKRISSLPPYGDEVLHSVNDFRIMVGIRCLIAFCRAIGIASPLEPVLSFPLGSNVITLYEAAKAYEAITTGKAISWGKNASPELHIIARIEDREGVLLYEPKVTVRQVMPPQNAVMIAGILRNVMIHGTGRSAERKIRLHSSDAGRQKQLASYDLQLPLMGKTGTANRFTNSAFIGVLPGPTGKDVSLAIDKGFTLGAYVGYDDNRQMVYKAHRISGALGALPIWTRIVDAIIGSEDFASQMDEADLAFHGDKILPLALPQLGQKLVFLDDGRGGVPTGTGESRREGGRAMTFAFGETEKGGAFTPARTISPFWQTSEFDGVVGKKQEHNEQTP